MPERIGIVTSPTGAVIRTFCRSWTAAFPGRTCRIYPAQVQGDGSVEQIAAGIEYFSRYGWAEVTIVARGGGSLEDLWTFNEERVARAIVASAVPVISAVGHETDFTIADFVADLRAPTPSAAAELVICTRRSLTIVRRLRNEADGKRCGCICADGSPLARDRGRPGALHRAIGKQMQRVDELDYGLRDRWRAERCTAAGCRAVSARLAQLDVRLRFARARPTRNVRSIAGQAMKLRLSAARGGLGGLEPSGAVEPAENARTRLRDRGA